MDDADSERTTINVKSVDVIAWNRAKSAANLQKQSMGVWLSRAINRLADAEDGRREFPPVPKANLVPEMGNLSPLPGNPSMDPDEQSVIRRDMAALMQGAAALAAAGAPLPKGPLRRAYRIAEDQMRAAQGLPPAPVRLQPVPRGKASGKTSLVGSKAAPRIIDETE